jgi:hypothetical protein
VTIGPPLKGEAMRNRSNLIAWTAGAILVLTPPLSPSLASPAGNSAPTTCGGAGRYQIIHSPQTERDTILLDTATGRSWQLVEAAGAYSWLPMGKLTD